MKKYVLIALAGLSLTACDIMKQSSKNKTEETSKQDYEQKEYRSSEAVLYNANMFKGLRDTTIVVVNSEGSKIQVQLDDKGQVRQAECIPGLIELLTKLSTQTDKTEKIKEKEKTEKFSGTWILYIVVGAVFIICFALVIMQRSQNKKFNAFASILDEIRNK